MKIQQFRPVLRTDVPEAEKWIDPLLNPVHEQIRDQTIALQGQLSFWDNLNTEPREIKVRHQQETEIVCKTLRGTPQGAFLIFWDYAGTAAITRTSIVDVDTIKVRLDFDPAPASGTEILVRVIVIGK